MVGPLIYFKKPAKSSKKGPTKRHWKGPGWYYHRGHGVWSKYSPLRDMKHDTHRKIVLKPGGIAVVYRKDHKPGLVGAGPYRQCTDSDTTRKTRKRKKSSGKSKKAKKVGKKSGNKAKKKKKK